MSYLRVCPKCSGWLDCEPPTAGSDRAQWVCKRCRIRAPVGAELSYRHMEDPEIQESTMTDEMLSQLKDVSPISVPREVFTIDGRRVEVMTHDGYDGPLLPFDNKPVLVNDSDGVLWEIGCMPNGLRVRRRR